MAKPNKFLSHDGYINVEAFVALAKEIDKVATKEQLKPTEIHFAGKVIPKYDTAKAKAGGEAFTKKRAQLIKMKTRMPQAGARMRMVVLLRDYKGLDEAHPEFDKDFNAAIDAIAAHNKLAEKTVATLKAAGAKKREAANKDFDKALAAFEDVLEAAGFDLDKSVAIGTSMMGKTMIVKLPGNNYVSIGKADAERFNKAKASGDAPATAKKAPVKKTTGTKTGRTSAAKAAPAAKPSTKKTVAAKKPVAKATVAKKPVRKTSR